MKKNRILKAVRTLCAAAIFGTALCSIISCGNSLNPQEKNSAQAETPFLRISVSEESARTVFPVMSSSEIAALTDVVLTGNRVNYEQTLNNTYTSIAAMQTSLQAEPLVLTGAEANESWNFKLTAKKGEAAFVANISNYTLVNGENYIAFYLDVDTALTPDTVKGNLSLTLDYSADTANRSYVRKAKGYIYDNSATYNYTGVLQDSFTQTFTPSADFKATYSVENIPAGTYRAVVYLYADDDCKETLATWREIVYIKRGITSSATRTIEMLNDIITVTYNYNYTGAAPAITETRTVGTSLPAPARSGYIFAGWYTDAACTTTYNPVSTVKTVTLYAKWVSNSSSYETPATIVDKLTNLNAAATSADVPAVIKLAGTYTTADLANIKKVLQDRRNAGLYLKLDFTNAVVYKIPDNFLNEDNSVVGVILPESLETFTGYSFYYSLKLASVEIADSNPNFKSVDGVVYTKDGTKLVCYPPKKLVEEFTVPETVTTIGRYGFSGSLKAKKVTVGGNVVLFEPYAFCSCTINNRNLVFTHPQNLLYTYGNSSPGYDYDTVIKSNNKAYYSLSYFADKWSNNETWSSYYAVKYGESFVNNYVTGTVKDVLLYQTESNKLSEGYTFYKYEGSTQWYRVNTEPGKVYKVSLYCGGYTGEFNNDISFAENLTSWPYLYAFGDNGYPYYTGNTGYEFIFEAKSNATYFYLSNMSTNYYAAFRVNQMHMTTSDMTININSQFDLAQYYVQQGYSVDYLIYRYVNGSTKYWQFDSRNYFSSYTRRYYVDGNLWGTDNYNSRQLYDSSLTKGAHVLMIEVIKDGKSYTYSKQVYVE